MVSKPQAVFIGPAVAERPLVGHVAKFTEVFGTSSSR